MKTKDSYSPNPATENYVRRAELGKFFTVSQRTISRWLREGCPCVRIGASGRGDARFRISAVEEWLNARTEIAKR